MIHTLIDTAAGPFSTHGYLDSLPASKAFDAATCLLVSHFILDQAARSRLFHSIAQRLQPGGTLVSSDLCADLESKPGQSLLEVWLKTMAVADVSPEALEKMRAAYRRDLAIRPAAEIEAIMVAGGFESPVQFFQAGLMRAWYAKRACVCSEA